MILVRLQKAVVTGPPAPRVRPAPPVPMGQWGRQALPVPAPVPLAPLALMDPPVRLAPQVSQVRAVDRGYRVDQALPVRPAPPEPPAQVVPVIQALPVPPAHPERRALPVLLVQTVKTA